MEGSEVSRSKFSSDERGLRGPSTKTGWAAVGFLMVAVVAAVLAFIGSLNVPGAEAFKSDWLPIWTMLVITCGVVAGALGTFAILRKNERSWVVYVTLVPIALMTLYVLSGLVTSLF